MDVLGIGREAVGEHALRRDDRSHGRSRESGGEIRDGKDPGKEDWEKPTAETRRPGVAEGYTIIQAPRPQIRPSMDDPEDSDVRPGLRRLLQRLTAPRSTYHHEEILPRRPCCT